jgi:uncharacterized protein YndB with AHSA1/START domain
MMEESMANRAIIRDQDSITCEIDIAAPPERVFQALTDPAQARQWGNSQEFKFRVWEMDARLGGKWRFLCVETSGKPNKYGVDEFDHWGEIIEIDPPQLLVYTWNTNFHENPKQKTIVRWDLTAIPTGTRLRVTHSGLADESKARADYSQGWPGLLQAVKAHAENQSGSKPAVFTSVTPDLDEVISEAHIAAPPERVFAALIDPKQVMQWWNSEQCPIDSFTMDARRGGRWTYDTRQSTLNVNGVSRFHCEGEVLEYDPPRVLAYTWIANWHEEPSQRTIVRWQLSKTNSGTHVIMTHSGLTNLPTSRKDYSNGWQGVMQSFKAHIEKHLAAQPVVVSNSMTSDNDALVSEIQITAPPERVFQALTDPKQVEKWWGREGVYRCTEFVAAVQAGGKWRSSGIGPDGGPFEIHGEYLEVDPPCVLAYTWIASWTGEVQTTVRWELEPSVHGTLLRIRHSGLAAHPELAQSYRGWPNILEWLRAYLESGDTVESRKAS